MAETFKFKVEGFKELDRQLKQLPGKVARKVGRTAMQRSGRPVRKAVRDEIRAATKGTGALRKSIGIKVKLYPRSQSIVAVVGPRTKFMLGGRKPSNYIHLIERGFTQKTITTGKGGIVKADPPIVHPGKHPVEKGWNRSYREALATMRKTLAEEIPKEAMKLRKH